MTADQHTAPDVGTIEHLDFEHAPPCEYSIHDVIGAGPAVWLVTLRTPLCGCPASPRLLMCDSCWQVRSDSQNRTYCRHCGKSWPSIDSIISAVRL